MRGTADALAQTTTSPELGEEMRRLLRQVPAAVAVVTTGSQGLAHGMTATAFTPVSLDPPSLLVSINRSASLHAPLTRRRAFAVNILTGDAADIARAFSNGALGHAERFAACSWRWHETGLPVLLAAQASFLCEVEERMNYGTHDLFVGRVTATTANGNEQPPLLVAGGRFVGLPKAAFGC
jgi:flavin reductase (DIM6/NTAB) family NADH-FMN oxidoreductase RutF